MTAKLSYIRKLTFAGVEILKILQHRLMISQLVLHVWCRKLLAVRFLENVADDVTISSHCSCNIADLRLYIYMYCISYIFKDTNIFATVIQVVNDVETTLLSLLKRGRTVRLVNHSTSTFSGFRR